MTDQSTPEPTECPCQTCPRKITILYDGGFKDYLEYHVNNYKTLKPFVDISLKPVEEGDLETLEQELLTSEEWDGALFPAQLVGTLVQSDVLWDMSDYARDSLELDWPEMLPFFRYQVATLDKRTRLIPLDGDLLSMYYRKDLFEEYDIPIPRTWDEYNAAAKFFDEKPLGPDGSPLFGSCVPRTIKCGNYHWTSLILSTMTQSMGSSSGFLLDPETLDPLFGAAMEETLRLTAEQFEYGHGEELTESCSTVTDAFNLGQCALTYNWGKQITASGFRFEVGVAPTPGSRRVLNRETGLLEDCTTTVCPYGVYYEDIGIVNHVPFSAFGGWASGVSNSVSAGNRFGAADFLSYLSNSNQSLGDVLPNSRSSFAQPYRYSHVSTLNWIDSGLNLDLAMDYTRTVRQVNSENAAMELRVPLGSALREVVDEEVSSFLLSQKGSNLMAHDEGNADGIQEIGDRMERRLQELISESNDREQTLVSYRSSLSIASTPKIVSENYIDENLRHAGWGLGGLICFGALSVIFWTLRLRSNRVMKAFQPFLLIQSAVGLFLMGGTIIPLGFDDSLFSSGILDSTCMAIPWLYVCGFTIFFSSVYCKIQECIKIYEDPHDYDVLVVKPGDALKLCLRLLFANGIVLAIWTITDPLIWTREEVENGVVFEDGVVETFGTCKSEGESSAIFVLVLCAFNLFICMTATVQAFRCRFLVLEYNEMQWLPLSILPYFEVWIIGGPIVASIQENPTVLFVVLTLIITAGSVTSAMAVFAPKDWYIRKPRKPGTIALKKFRKGLPKQTSSAGILVLKHPTVESQKELEHMENQLSHLHALNTELQIEIRSMKDKFNVLTAKEKLEVRGSLLSRATDSVKSSNHRFRSMENFEQTDVSRSNNVKLEAMNLFQQVWKMPDDDDEDENEVSDPMPLLSSIHSNSSAHSTTSPPPTSKASLKESQVSGVQDEESLGLRAYQKLFSLFPSPPIEEGHQRRSTSEQDKGFKHLIEATASEEIESEDLKVRVSIIDMSSEGEKEAVPNPSPPTRQEDGRRSSSKKKSSISSRRLVKKPGNDYAGESIHSGRDKIKGEKGVVNPRLPIGDVGNGNSTRRLSPVKYSKETRESRIPKFQSKNPSSPESGNRSKVAGQKVRFIESSPSSPPLKKSPRTSESRIPTLRPLNQSTSESGDLSYPLGDWSGVGGKAKVSSPVAKEIEKLIAEKDFDGVRLLAQKYEADQNGEESPVLKEKRRKKRELEDLRASISKRTFES